MNTKPTRIHIQLSVTTEDKDGGIYTTFRSHWYTPLKDRDVVAVGRIHDAIRADLRDFLETEEIIPNEDDPPETDDDRDAEIMFDLMRLRQQGHALTTLALNDLFAYEATVDTILDTAQ